jgi:penicillin-binding protein 2
VRKNPCHKLALALNDARKYIVQLVFIAVALLFASRLYNIQVADAKYQVNAEKNAIRKIPVYPLRGFIYDRNNKLIVNNHPVFDIKIIAADLIIKDSLRLAEVLELSHEELRRRLERASKYRYQPYLLVKQLSAEQFAKIQDYICDYPGLFAESRTVRSYPYKVFAGGLGYVKEIDKTLLESDAFNGDGYYSQGDMVGRTGIEQSYEKELRGRRGVRSVMFNAMGVEKGSFRDGIYDTLPVVGKDLISTIDIELQEYGEELMKNKIGSIVAIEPETGEILSMVSSPSFDPNLLTGEGKDVTRNYLQLLRDPNKPLFNRAVMAAYPPGSTLKVVNSLIALQEGVADAEHTIFSCSQDIVKCHEHPSTINLPKAIQYSCNPYYYKLFQRMIKQKKSEDDMRDTRIGLENWRNHMLSFGLGRKLGTDLLNEKPGLVPSVAYYDKKYKNPRNPWRLANIYSLSIGQGEVNVVPLQLANVAAIVANRGFYYIPHLAKRIGDTTEIDIKYRTKNYASVESKHYGVVIDAMSEVVRSGTARRAFIPDVEVCGKTGTVQNSRGDDHSVFMAFAPKKNPKIAIAVIVENSGFGGSWAAPIASLMIEKYINGEIKRTEEEKRILEANLLTTDGKKKTREKDARDSQNRKKTPEELDQLLEASAEKFEGRQERKNSGTSALISIRNREGILPRDDD